MSTKEQTWVLGDLYTLHLVSPELALIEIESRQQQGPPLHSHREEQESFFVVEGAIEVSRGGRLSTARKGDFVHFAKGELHTYRNVSPEGSRFLVTIAPGHFAQLFRDIGVNDASSAHDPRVLQETQAKLMSLASEYGLFIAPPPAK